MGKMQKQTSRTRGVSMPYLEIENGESLILDKSDWEIARQYRWKWIKADGILSPKVYVENRKYKAISSVVFEVSEKSVLLHKNNDKTDYRRENILICTKKEAGYLTGHSVSNSRKKSKYWGVSLRPLGWAIRDNSNKTRTYIYYQSEDAAALVADYNAIKKYGDKARINFPELSFEELKARVEGIEEEKAVLQKVKISSGNQGVKPKTDKKSSKYVGVYWDKSRNRWSVEITFKRKKIYIGRFENEDDAGMAYDMKALELYGEGAKLNFAPKSATNSDRQ
jgi:hypothetical protein